jgi:hypothetical protein
MINYNWNCRTVECYINLDGNSDVVYNVYYRVTGVSDTLDPYGGNYAFTSTGNRKLTTNNITEFIPFSELTNEQVVTWTKSAMGVDRVAKIEADIAYQIDLQINPVTVILEIPDPNI